MSSNEIINYVEYPARDLAGTKRFFQQVFEWSFQDYGPDYAAFSSQGLDGGFFKSELAARTDQGSALVIFHSDNLEGALDRVVAAGGEIIKPIFSFPGGRRFHFVEPSGNEFAVWSKSET